MATEWRSEAAAPALSVIIPARDEEARIESALAALDGWDRTEVIVAVDAGTRDATAAVAGAHVGVRIVESALAGRGAAMAAGARAARADLLLFLHVDSRIDASAVTEARARITCGAPAAAFRIRLDSPRFVFRLLELGIHLRCRLFGLPYGDQGLVISRAMLDGVGGFRPLRRCEDLDLVLRLRRRGGVVLVPGPCRTSTRRWDREGVLQVTISNLTALARFVLGGAVPDDSETVRSPGGRRPGRPAVVPGRLRRGKP